MLHEISCPKIPVRHSVVKFLTSVQINFFTGFLLGFIKCRHVYFLLSLTAEYISFIPDNKIVPAANLNMKVMKAENVENIGEIIHIQAIRIITIINVEINAC